MPRTPRFVASVLAGAALVGALAAPTAGASSTEPPREPSSAPPSGSARYEPGGCFVAVPDTPGGPVECGQVWVPLHHERPDGEEISLAVATVPAAVPTGAPPLVILAGGPGESLVAPVLAALATSGPGGGVPFTLLAADRDVVLVEQRGVGLSRPNLDCPEVTEGLAGATDPAQLGDRAVDAFGACHDRLVADGIDLSAFNTTNNAEDIGALGAALGYQQIDLFGTSYGARLALQVTRDHSDVVSHLVLASPVPAERNFIDEVGTSYDRALRRLDHACASDASCAAMLPGGLLSTFHDVLWSLTATPVELPATDPQTGEVEVGTLSAALFDTIVYSMFYGPSGPQVVPILVAAAAAGDYSMLTDVTALPDGDTAPDQPALPAATASGMQASFICSEEAAQTPPGQQDPGETYAAQLITATNPVIGGPQLAQLCERWNVPAAPARVFEPVTTDVPTLIATGRFDQITPPSYGLEIERALPNDIYVEFAGGGHSPLFGGGECGLQILHSFISDDWWALDTSCAATPPPFIAGGGGGGAPQGGAQ